MSLVKQGDSSAPSYREPKLYIGKSSSSNDSNISNQVFRPDKRMFNYGAASQVSDISDQQCLSDSVSQWDELLCPSNSGSLRSPIQPEVSSSPYQVMDSSRSLIDAQSPYSSCFSAIRHAPPSFASVSHQTSGITSYSLSPENEMGCDESEIRSKLEELERALLSDNDEDMLDESEGIGIDDEWIDPIKNLLLPGSPRESSSDSNISSTESCVRESRTPKHMLFDCAAAISEGNFEAASALITELRQMVSIQGDPPQRLAAYLVEGLAARMASSGQGLYRALKCKEPPTSDRLSAMQILFEVCPCFKFGFMAANGAIAEAFKDEEKVHIIDFDINQGSQYITLMQTLSTRNNMPQLRITGVDDPESVQRSVGGLKIIGQRLEKLAEELGIPFEFRAIAAKTAEVTPPMLGCRTGEALVVNFAYQLHHMPDESVSTVNERDQLLRMVKGLGPKMVTVIEQDVNTNTAPFFPRFVEVYNYYHAVFESLDATLPRNSADRMNVERQCLARDIVNIVACEGAERIERYEAAGKWRARMTMAGFVSCPLSSYVNEEIRAQLKLYSDKYKLKEEAGALHFGWEDKILVVASAWR